MSQPLIGMSAHTHTVNDYVRYACAASYVRAVIVHGGIPVLIPPGQTGASLHQVLEGIHGLLLPGGVDLGPRHYGHTAHAKLGSVDAELDALELPLARIAYALDIPILGICRGIQSLAVALGGSLCQDIPSEMDCVPHEVREHGRSHPAHDINIDPESRLAHIMGATMLRVNSLHHQCVRDLPDSLAAVARAPDGVVEAVEGVDKRFVVAVQCHPEEMWESTLSDFSHLFEAFIAAARDYGNHRIQR